MEVMTLPTYVSIVRVADLCSSCYHVPSIATTNVVRGTLLDHCI